MRRIDQPLLRHGRVTANTLLLLLLGAAVGTILLRGSARNTEPAPAAGIARSGVAAALKEAVERQPGDVGARLAYGRYLLKSGDYLGARARFEEAVRLAPDRADGHLAMAELFEAVDMFDTAIAAARTAVRRDPGSAEAVAALGRLYLGMDWNVASLDVLQEGVARFPGSVPVRVALTRTLFQMSDFPAALKQADIVRRLEPENRELDARLVDIFLRLQRDDEALAAAERGLARTPGDPMLAAARARVLNTLGRFPEAESAVRPVLRERPAHEPCNDELAIALEGQGRLDEAARVYEGIIGRNFRYGRAALKLAVLYSRLGRRGAGAALARRFRDAEEADTAASRALVRVGNRPEDPDAHLAAGILHQEGGRIPRAVVEYRETLRLRPGDREAARRLKQTLEVMRRPREAREIATPGSGASDL